MTRSLTFKLTAAFVLVSLVGIIIVAILLRLVTPIQVNELLENRYTTELHRAYTQYYVANNSWDNANVVFATFGDEGAPAIMVFDSNRQIQALSGRRIEPGRVELPQNLMEQAEPIVVDGASVGFVIAGHDFQQYMDQHQGDRRGGPNQERSPSRPTWVNPPLGSGGSGEFIRPFNLLLLGGGAAAVVVSIMASVILAQTLTRPIKTLTEATKALGSGTLGEQVAIHSQDELGSLAQSFNDMSQRLQQAQAQRQQMTANIAHELRTPLSTILGHTEALTDGVFAPTPDRLAVIHAEALRLEHLIEDLRVLALSDAGELKIHPEMVTAGELLAQTTAAFTPLAAAKGISLERQTGGAEAALYADPKRIAQVLGNLTSNAIRYTPEHGKIILRATHTPDSRLLFEVRDSGDGIDVTDLPNLFERFYRADKSRARNDGGSGLGLAIARSIVEAHGGTIRAQNAPEGGAVFQFTLPVNID